MKEVSGFFDKFNNLALKELNKRDKISSIIQKLTKQKINYADINLKEGILAIKGNQLLKSEIYMKKQQIISLLNKEGIKIKDIK